jgi:serine/threonine-protein kinase RsbW
MSTRSFPAKFEILNDVREYVGELARTAGFGDKAVYAVQLAADEAASNIIEHAYAGHADSSFSLRCEYSRDRLMMTFRDKGRSFDFSNVDEPDISADLSTRKIGGLGIFLMHKLMDAVTYKVTSAGNYLTLIKRKE